MLRRSSVHHIRRVLESAHGVALRYVPSEAKIMEMQPRQRARPDLIRARHEETQVKASIRRIRNKHFAMNIPDPALAVMPFATMSSELGALLRECYAMRDAYDAGLLPPLRNSMPGVTKFNKLLKIWRAMIDRVLDGSRTISRYLMPPHSGGFSQETGFARALWKSPGDHAWLNSSLTLWRTTHNYLVQSTDDVDFHLRHSFGIIVGDARLYEYGNRKTGPKAAYNDLVEDWRRIEVLLLDDKKYPGQGRPYMEKYLGNFTKEALRGWIKEASVLRKSCLAIHRQNDTELASALRPLEYLSSTLRATSKAMTHFGKDLLKACHEDAALVPLLDWYYDKQRLIMTENFEIQDSIKDVKFIVSARLQRGESVAPFRATRPRRAKGETKSQPFESYRKISIRRNTENSNRSQHHGSTTATQDQA